MVARVRVDLYGSLALTGKGHGTDRALMLGLIGYRPDSLCPDAADDTLALIRAYGELRLGSTKPVVFDEHVDILYHQRERLPFHSNGMRFSAFGGAGETIEARTYYSIGGGATVDEHDVAANAPPGRIVDFPYPFASGDELLAMADKADLSLADLALANECTLLPEAEVRKRLAVIAEAMTACIDRGMAADGILPGGLSVKRRAGKIHETLIARQERALSDPLSVLDWVNLWALAVNEENAAGGRVVTAPTNGAAGIVPAVLRYYQRFIPGADEDGTARFMLVAGVIGSLFKENASISGAEVGCQGEVGVACSMAAGGLTAVLGGSNRQIENAAEIGMEHNLGLTCDPVGGLVQVPCIERNAVGAVKAIEAARLALLGDGTHRVSLDQVIETMRRTGADMNERYKETSLGGLAVNVVEC
jgi:L-serine dehydratase